MADAANLDRRPPGAARPPSVSGWRRCPAMAPEAGRPRLAPLQARRVLQPSAACWGVARGAVAPVGLAVMREAAQRPAGWRATKVQAAQNPGLRQGLQPAARQRGAARSRRPLRRLRRVRPAECQATYRVCGPSRTAALHEGASRRGEVARRRALPVLLARSAPDRRSSATEPPAAVRPYRPDPGGA
jgi:hypothetical protein